MPDWKRCAKKSRSARKLLDWRLLANGHADQLLYERRQIDTDLPIASLRAQSNITERAKAADHSPDFCRRIRLGLPDFNEP